MSLRDIIKSRITAEIVMEEGVVDGFEKMARRHMNEAEAGGGSGESVRETGTADSDMSVDNGSEIGADDAVSDIKDGANELKDEAKGMEMTAGILEALRTAVEDGIITAEEYTGDVKKGLSIIFKAIAEDVWDSILSSVKSSTKDAIRAALDGGGEDDFEDDMGDTPEGEAPAGDEPAGMEGDAPAEV